jgi:hypothetical protein
VYKTLKRLRQKIDSDVGRVGAGAPVILTVHQGQRTTDELHDRVIDQVDGGHGTA